MSATRCRTTDLACYPLDNLKNRVFVGGVYCYLKEMPAHFSAISRDSFEVAKKKILRLTGTNEQEQETNDVCHNGAFLVKIGTAFPHVSSAILSSAIH